MPQERCWPPKCTIAYTASLVSPVASAPTRTRPTRKDVPSDASRASSSRRTRAAEHRRSVAARARVGRRAPARSDDRGPHQAAIHLGAIAKRGDVAGRRRQPIDEGLFELGAAELVEILQRHRRVPEDLYRLDRRDLVEEPAAGGEHEQAILLELEEGPGLARPRAVPRGAR